MGSSEGFSGRLIQDDAHDGAFNMAADVYLADLARQTGELILRLYTWDKPTLSLGYHQEISHEALSRYLQKGIPIIRRPTGGRAVLHDRELTYALALPARNFFLGEGKDRLLERIGTAFVAAAAKLGLKAELVRSGNRQGENVAPLHRGSPLCFESVSRWEVRLQGQKWIGSAQRLLPAAFLQHGSILLSRCRSDGAAMGNPQIDELDLRRAIPEALSELWGIAWRNANFNQAERLEIASLSASHEFDFALRIAS